MLVALMNGLQLSRWSYVHGASCGGWVLQLVGFASVVVGVVVAEVVVVLWFWIMICFRGQSLGWALRFVVYVYYFFVHPALGRNRSNRTHENCSAECYLSELSVSSLSLSLSLSLSPLS